jgi:hypothetical protein
VLGPKYICFSKEKKKRMKGRKCERNEGKKLIGRKRTSTFYQQHRKDMSCLYTEKMTMFERRKV